MWAYSHDVEEAEPPVGQRWGGFRPEKTISARIPRLGADLKIVLPGDESPGTSGTVTCFTTAGVWELELQFNLFVTVRTYHAREVRRQLRNNPCDLFPHCPTPSTTFGSDLEPLTWFPPRLESLRRFQSTSSHPSQGCSFSLFP